MVTLPHFKHRARTGTHNRAVAWFAAAISFVCPAPAASAQEPVSTAGQVFAEAGSLHPKLKFVLGLGSGATANFSAREKMLRKMDAILDERDLSALGRYISGDRPVEMSPGQWHGFVNSGLGTLRSHGTRGREVARERLLPLSGDAAGDPVLRCYAVQHLGAMYIENEIEGEPARAEVLDALVKTAGDPTSQACGDALLALLRIHELDPATVPAGGLEAAAVSAIRSGGEANGTLVAALQVCRILKTETVAAPARALAFDTARPVGIRGAAVAYLAEIGADLAELKQSISTEDPEVRMILENSLKAGGR